MLQFTIKPLDKKKDVFKFYSSQLRVNKLVGVSDLFYAFCKGSAITKLCEGDMNEPSCLIMDIFVHLGDFFPPHLAIMLAVLMHIVQFFFKRSFCLAKFCISKCNFSNTSIDHH